MTIYKDQVILSLESLCIEASNIYEDIKSYPYHQVMEQLTKSIFDTIFVIRKLVTSYTGQCNQLTPYLQHILPSDLEAIIIQQMCAIVFIASFIACCLVFIFMILWIWYRNMINQYLSQ